MNKTKGIAKYGATLLVLTFVITSVKADPTQYTPDELVGFAKAAADTSVEAHRDLAPHGFLVTGCQVGRVSRGGQVFDGSVVFYSFVDADGTPNKGEDVTHDLDRARLPNPLLDWVVKTPTPGDFTLAELLTAAKLATDRAKVESGGDESHKVVTFKVFRSESEFPVVARVAWRHLDPSTGEVKKGEYKYGCHKHDQKLECHREN